MTAKPSISNSKTSEEIPEHTNPGREFQVAHQVQSLCFIVLQAHTHRFFNNPESSQAWSSGPEIGVETNFLSSPWPSNQGRRETHGSMEWANLQVFAAFHFPYHSLSKTDLAKPWKCRMPALVRPPIIIFVDLK
jgi:hypothetical protein